MAPRRVLIVGATGMLGNAMFRFFSASDGFETFGTVRSLSSRAAFDVNADRLVLCSDATDADALLGAVDAARPNIIVNCIGVVKQLSNAGDPLVALPINAMLPHRLARIGKLVGARTILISTDCVFSGDKGNYTETDKPDAADVYGRSKLLGEVDDGSAITLRTSIIGHEIGTRHGLVDWFLGQTSGVLGFRRAIFSGVPTCELARIVRDFVLPQPQLTGLYHVSAEPIDKYALLREVGKQYSHAIHITPDDSLAINRSLDSSKFREATGYSPPPWPALVSDMHAYR